MEMSDFRVVLILILVSFTTVSITPVLGQESAADYWRERGNESLRDGQFEEADKFFEKAVEFDPSYVKTWILKGESFHMQRRYSDSLQAYENAIEFSQSKQSAAEAWNGRGVALHNLGQYGEAIEAYHEAIELDPLWAEPWNNLGDAFKSLGDYNESVDAYSRATELDPDWDIPLQNKGYFLTVLGKKAELDAAFAKDGYKLAIQSVDINGNKAYMELIKDGSVVDSKVIIAANEVDDTFAYSRPGTSQAIKVHFKNTFRGADTNLATIDSISQNSESDPSRILINDTNESIITSGRPLGLGEGYELAIKSIDIDGNKAYLQLSKDGSVVDSRVIIAANDVEDTFVYSRPGTSQAIKVRFKNAFRGANEDLTTVDNIQQTSEIDPSKILRNDSQRRIITTRTLLKLEEGYELEIKAIDVDGNKVYIELFKDGSFVDSKVIIAANDVDDTFIYSGPGTMQTIMVHFRNVFRGADQNLATIDNIRQTSETNPSRILIKDSLPRTFATGTPLKLREEYELAAKSVDIDGNKVYIELLKDGVAVDSKIIVAAKEVDDTFIYSKPGTSQEITIHFKNTFRGADSNLATVENVRQISETDPSRILVDDPLPWTISKGTTLKMEEGYELEVKSIDIDGNKVYIELLKDGVVVDSRVIIAANGVDDTFVYSKPGIPNAIKVHFKNAFRGRDQNLVTVDNVQQTSEIDLNRILVNDSHSRTLIAGTPLKLEEGYELAVKSVDIDGNKVYIELLKDGDIVDSKVILAANKVDDTYVYSKPGTSDAINVHFKNAFRGADQYLVTIDDTAQGFAALPPGLLSAGYSG